MEPCLRIQLKPLKYRLINRFVYKKLERLPNIVSVRIESNYKTSEKIELLRNNAFIRLIANSKPKLIKALSNDEDNNIKKGKPVGKRGTVPKQQCFSFLLKLIYEFAKDIGESNWESLQKEMTKKKFLFELGYLLNLPEINTNYQVLKKLANSVLVVELSSCLKSETKLLWSLLNLSRLNRQVLKK